MASLNTAKTRIGVGGPSINYSRPIQAKAETDAPDTQGKNVLFTISTGQLMNNL